MTTSDRSVIALILLIPALACAHPRRAGKPLIPIAQLAEPRASHTATPLSDGTILIAGGFRKGPDGYSQLYTATTEIVDPAGAVHSGPAMVHARAGHIAVALADSRVLVAGGWDDHGLVRTAELYDPATAAFTAVGDLGEARGSFAAALLADGSVLVCGGGEATPLATAERFDPADAAFHPTGAMTAARVGHTATVLADGTVLIVGGSDAGGHVLDSAERYDPTTGAFTATGAMAVARYKHAAIRLADDRVLVAGGSDDRDWTGKYASTEIYDPATATFTAGPKLTAARFKLPHAVVLTASGAVAIAGGASTVELVTPSARSRAIGRFGHALYYSTATLAGDRLIVVGGYDDRVRTHTDVWSVAVQ